jgi:Ca2+-binding RTX toxin-like protein
MLTRHRLAKSAALVLLLSGAAAHAAVHAGFSTSGVLTVTGDVEDDRIVVGRDPAGNIFVNDGSVPIAGGAPRVATTHKIVLRGGAGDDLLALDETGGPLPSAKIVGGPGRDTLRGGSANDELRGGPDDDTLEGGPGEDVVKGDGGDDVLVWRDGDGADRLDGGLGTDSAVVEGDPVAGDQFQISPSRRGVLVERTNLVPIALDFARVERLELDTLGGNDEVVASDGFTSGPSLRIDGGEGDDVITGSDGPDVLIGGGGEDQIMGRDGDDVLDGGNGADVVFGGDDDDILLGGEGDDVLDAGNGDDVLLGGPGLDLLLPGPGDNIAIQD